MELEKQAKRLKRKKEKDQYKKQHFKYADDEKTVKFDMSKFKFRGEELKLNLTM